MAFFPGVVMNGNWTFFEKDSAWLPIFIVGVWHLCDNIGTYLPGYCKTFALSRFTVRFLTIIKTSFVFFALHSVPTYSSAKFFQTTEFQVFNLVFSGITKGLCSVLCVIHGTEKV